MATIKMFGLVAALAATLAGASGAQAQSSAASYSMGTYNPVQAAIWRNQMNEAILRQAGKGGHASAKKHVRSHRRAG